MTGSRKLLSWVMLASLALTLASVCAWESITMTGAYFWITYGETVSGSLCCPISCSSRVSGVLTFPYSEPKSYRR